MHGHFSEPAVADRSPAVPAHWPTQADLVLSALESGQHARPERRAVRRRAYRAVATLRLFSDTNSAAPWTLYTRDACPRGLGFITPHRLPLGYGGVLELPLPDGAALKIQCTVHRCRQAAPGWFEGALHFNREQVEFSQPLGT